MFTDGLGLPTIRCVAIVNEVISPLALAAAMAHCNVYVAHDVPNLRLRQSTKSYATITWEACQLVVV